MRQITTKQLLNSYAALARLAAKEPRGTSAECFQFAYDIAKVLKTCKEAAEQQSAAQAALYQRYGAKFVGQQMFIDYEAVMAENNGEGAARVEEIKAALKAFDETKVDVWDKTFSQATLVAAQITPPSGADVDALSWLLVDEAAQAAA